MDYICFKIYPVYCPSCYQATIKSCSESIVLTAGLTPSTTYYWVIKNKFGKLYQRQATTDVNGNLTIDLTVLPEGATNEFSGFFELTLKEGTNYLNNVNMTFGEKAYGCVMFDFAAIDDTNAHNVIK